MGTSTPTTITIHTTMGTDQRHSPATSGGDVVPTPQSPETDVTGDLSMLQLMWLASPALPVGGFSYSEGLESAVAAGAVFDAESASRWLLDQLHLTVARADLAVLAQAVLAWQTHDPERLRALNAWVLATRETSELRAQTVQMGRSLLDWLRNHTTAAQAQLDLLTSLRPSYPLAFALAASATGAPVRQCLLSYAFGWAENMVQAAIKSVPLGQLAGQRVLSALTADISRAVDYALTQSDATRQSFAPMLAIHSSQHETQYSRLFRS